MADAYARQNDTKGEFALYDVTLADLGTQLTRDSGGLRLTAAGPQLNPPPQTPETKLRVPHLTNVSLNSSTSSAPPSNNPRKTPASPSSSPR